MSIPTNASEPNQTPPSNGKGLARFFGGMVLMVLGAGVLLGGFVLYAGNKSGRLPTFPYAGALTMTLGLVLVAGAVILAGRLGAVLLGILLILAGIVMFVLGLTKDEPLYALFPLAGVIVAVVGGGVIYAVIGSLSQPGK